MLHSSISSGRADDSGNNINRLIWNFPNETELRMEPAFLPGK
jgi:hypothetical protein